MLTLINGREAAHVSISDRGLLYGDGLFETIAVRHGKLQHWELHLERLTTGCQRLGMPCPPGELLRAEAESACRGADQAVVRITLTRGVGQRGYRPPSVPEPTRIVQGLPWPDMPDAAAREGVAIRWCHLRLARQPLLAGLKHLNRLEQILARAEWQDEYAEGLMLDTEGQVIEGTMTNLFLVREGTLSTPDLSQCGVAGVMRAVILGLAKEHGIPHAVEHITPSMVEQADEVFLTNSVIGIWPVARLEARSYVVGGKVTQTLQAAFQSNG